MSKAPNSNEIFEGFVFEKQNYILLVIGVVVIALGMLLMVGGGSDDPNVFNAEELFSTRRITISPIVILAGFAIVLFSIFKKSKKNSSDSATSSEE